MLVLLCAQAALAQQSPLSVPDIDTRLFRPAPSIERYLWTDDAGTRVRLSGSGQAVLSWTDASVVHYQPDGQEQVLLDDALITDVQGTVGWDRFRLAVGVPMILTSTSVVEGSRGGLGDVDLGLRATALDRESAALGLGLSGRVQLPTGGDTNLLSESGVMGELMLLVEKELGPLRLATNLGARFRPEETLVDVGVDDQLLARLGAGLELGETRGLSLDLGIDSGDTDPEVAGTPPASWLLGGWQELGEHWQLRAGAGTGLTAQVGSPSFQAVLGLAWVASKPRGPLDADGDGIFDEDDVCPYEPETRDGVRDGDGCPEGVPGMATSSADGGQDDEDSGIALPDSTDDDGDGIAAYEDRCPDQAEDPDGFEDGDGCPDLDDDGDGLPDDVDQCPTQAETFNSFEDEDGCPEELPDQVAEVVGAVEGILFASGSDRLLRRSRPVLEKVRTVMDDYPDLGLRIEGHTDDVGSRDLNLDLSERRAAAVQQWLVDAGIDATRLSSAGFGPDRPVAPNDSDANRALNRRVELVYTKLEVSP